MENELVKDIVFFLRFWILIHILTFNIFYLSLYLKLELV